MRANYKFDGLYDEGLETDFSAGPNTADQSSKDRFGGSYREGQTFAGPTYTNDNSGKLKKAFGYVIDSLRNYFKKELGLEVDESDFTGVRIAFGNPLEYEKEKRQAAEEGVILGLYDPETNQIVINDIYKRDLEISRSKGFGEGGSIGVPSLERVLAEELVHRLQRKYGTLDLSYRRLGKRGGRDRIEGTAATIAEEALGEPTNIYQREKREYVDSIGRHPNRDKKRGSFLEPFATI